MHSGKCIALLTEEQFIGAFKKRTYPDWWCRGPLTEEEERRKGGRKRRMRTKRRCE